MNILLTNDDGIFSENIRALAKALGAHHTVYVFAPNIQKSACSHSLTVHNTIAYSEPVEIEGAKLSMAVEGSPADCIKVALHKFGIEPELVVSGPNEGSNLGTDILYSGTVAGAMEGLVCGKKAIALSQCGRAVDPVLCIDFFIQNFEKLYSMCSYDYILNINMPNASKEDIKGVVFSKMGFTKYSDAYIELLKEGKKVYRLTGERIYCDDAFPDCDIKFSQRNFVTITPVKMDRTDYNALSNLEKLNVDFLL